jgi:hypothetical protein
MDDKAWIEFLNRRAYCSIDEINCSMVQRTDGLARNVQISEIGVEACRGAGMDNSPFSGIIKFNYFEIYSRTVHPIKGSQANYGTSLYIISHAFHRHRYPEPSLPIEFFCPRKKHSLMTDLCVRTAADNSNTDN